MTKIIKLGLFSFLLTSAFLLSSCDEECRFDNSSPWISSSSPGVYNCIDTDNECGNKKCTLFKKGPEEGAQWESTGESQIPRPRGMESPTDDPNSYKCECE